MREYHLITSVINFTGLSFSYRSFLSSFLNEPLRIHGILIGRDPLAKTDEQVRALSESITMKIDAFTASISALPVERMKHYESFFSKPHMAMPIVRVSDTHYEGGKCAVEYNYLQEAGLLPEDESDLNNSADGGGGDSTQYHLSPPEQIMLGKKGLADEISSPLRRGSVVTSNDGGGREVLNTLQLTLSELLDSLRFILEKKETMPKKRKRIETQSPEASTSSTPTSKPVLSLRDIVRPRSLSTNWVRDWARKACNNRTQSKSTPQVSDIPLLSAKILENDKKGRRLVTVAEGTVETTDARTGLLQGANPKKAKDLDTVCSRLCRRRMAKRFLEMIRSERGDEFVGKLAFASPSSLSSRFRVLVEAHTTNTLSTVSYTAALACPQAPVSNTLISGAEIKSTITDSTPGGGVDGEDTDRSALPIRPPSSSPLLGGGHNYVSYGTLKSLADDGYLVRKSLLHALYPFNTWDRGNGAATDIAVPLV